MGLYNDKIGIYTKKYDLKPKSNSVYAVHSQDESSLLPSKYDVHLINQYCFPKKL